MKTISLIATSLTIALLNAVAGAQAPRVPGSPRPALPQIEIDSTFFTIPADAAARLGLTSFGETSRPARGGRLRGAELQKLLESLSVEKSVTVISSPRVTTRSSQRAVIEIIREIRYPTEFELVNGDQIAPKTFETRNVGVSMEVESVVSEDGLIDINATPIITTFHRFVQYAGGKTQAPGPIPRDGFSQPIFDFSQCSATATLRSGQALLLGGYAWHGSEEAMLLPNLDPAGAKPEAGPPKEPKLLFVALTTKLVTPLGNHAGIKAGAPVTITSQFAAVTRDRLPEWMVPLAGDALNNPGQTEESRKALEAAGLLGKPGLQLAGVLNPAQLEQVRKALETNAAGSLSTSPVKTIASNERYFAEASGWLRYPASKTAGEVTGQPKGESLGVERLDLQLAVEALVGPDGTIDLNIIPNLITSPKPTNEAPVGAGSGTSAEWKLLKEEPRWTGKAVTTSVSIWSGTTVFFLKASEGHPDRLQILLISASGSSAGEGAAAAGPTEPQKTPAPATDQKTPFAKPVPNKPGFVTSPHAPEKGYIDVRGFPQGTEVKCPYSGKSFLVP